MTNATLVTPGARCYVISSHSRYDNKTKSTVVNVTPSGMLDVRMDHWAADVTPLRFRKDRWGAYVQLGGSSSWPYKLSFDCEAIEKRQRQAAQYDEVARRMHSLKEHVPGNAYYARSKEDVLKSVEELERLLVAVRHAAEVMEG